MNNTVELPSLYYKDNFEALCQSVWSQYEDLLSQSERHFYALYEGLGAEARCLYIRLVSRRGVCFRSEQLNYAELGDLSQPMAELTQAGLLAIDDNPEPQELFRLLRKPELLEIFAEELEGKRSYRKQQLQDYLSAELTSEAIVARWLGWRPVNSTLVEVCYQDCIELLQLLFFGNRHQGLTDFVLSDLGVVRHHPYRLDRAHRLFGRREEIDDYLYLGVLREQFDQALEEGDKESMLELVAPLLESGPSVLLEQRRDKLRNRLARQLEREECLLEALGVYEVCMAHPARERRVRIFNKQQRYQAARDLCIAMDSNPWCEEEIDFLQRQMPQLDKKLGLPGRVRKKDSFLEEHLCLQRKASVEQASAAHYGRNWQRSEYVENSLMNSVFGLAFWDQIFQSVPGAFVNPYQAAPLDMYSREFYARRSDSIEAKLEELEEGFAEYILALYDENFGISNRWINWRYLEREMLAAALRTIPLNHWRAIWRRILFDPGANRSGFPDLICLNAGQDYCLIEVKGPGDQLQLNQRRWLRFFAQQGIPARVAWVEWCDD